MNNDVFVLDCSATMPWIFDDEATAETEQLFNRLIAGARAWVPALWHLEVGNTLLKAMRRGQITQAQAEIFLAKLQAFNITVDPETMTRAWGKTHDLAREHQLSAYDATYLELALRRGLPLASMDEALTAAARQTGLQLLL
jgi:predicted nucleic acid-binding protein